MRDALLGQVFGLGAIVRSGISIDAAAAREIATVLVQIADKKSFLTEVAGEGQGRRRDGGGGQE